MGMEAVGVGWGAGQERSLGSLEGKWGTPGTCFTVLKDMPSGGGRGPAGPQQRLASVSGWCRAWGGSRVRMGVVVERRQTGLQDRLQRQKGGGHKRPLCQPDFRGALALLETMGTGRGASGGLVWALVSISRASEVGEMGGCRSLELRRIWVESGDMGVDRQLRRTWTGDEGSGSGGED